MNQEKVLERVLENCENCGIVLHLCSLNRQLRDLCETRYRRKIQRITLLSIRCFYAKLKIMLRVLKSMERANMHPDLCRQLYHDIMHNQIATIHDDFELHPHHPRPLDTLKRYGKEMTIVKKRLLEFLQSLLDTCKNHPDWPWYRLHAPFSILLTKCYAMMRDPLPNFGLAKMNRDQLCNMYHLDNSTFTLDDK